MKILDIGCGKDKYPGAIGLDVTKLDGVDVVADLNKEKIPFPDNTFDMIVMKTSIEHFKEPVQVLEDVWRAGKNGAIVKIWTNYWDNYQTIFHYWRFDEYSFNEMIVGHKHEKYYSKAKFKKREVKLQKRFWFLPAFLRHIIKNVITGIYFEFEIVKPEAAA
jgi:ubiquinone/menaquinone biosynthesis C-methylase UbiE